MIVKSSQNDCKFWQVSSLHKMIVHNNKMIVNDNKIIAHNNKMIVNSDKFQVILLDKRGSDNTNIGVKIGNEKINWTSSV